MSLRVLLVFAMLTLPMVTSASEDPDPYLTLPLLTIGAVAVYDDLIYTIEGFAEITDRSGRTIPVVAIAHEDTGSRPSQHRHFLGVNSMLREMTMHLGGNDVVYSWDIQGLPDPLGASVLQGFKFTMGSSWEIPGDCALCAKPIRVDIEAPRHDSPPGTAYVAVVRMDLGYHVVHQVHMGTEHPFPLAVDIAAPYYAHTFNLQSVTSGSESIDVGSFQAPEHEGLAAVPFADNRPVEGTPWPGHRSWEEARQHTGRDDGAATEGARFLMLTAGIERAQITTVGELSVRNQDYVWESRYSTPEGAEFVARHILMSVLVGSLPGDPVSFWRSSSRTEAPIFLTPPSCESATVPIWDVADSLRDKGLPIHGVNSYMIQPSGCGYRIRIIPSMLEGVREVEWIDADLGTGLLLRMKLNT